MTMNDPHVMALHYKMKFGEYVDFEKAPPLDYENPDFKVHVEDDNVTVEMKTHFADHDDAKAIVDEFMRTWEVGIGLEIGPGLVSFQHDHTDMVNRNPSPGAPSTYVVGTTRASFSAVIQLSPDKYPSPPESLRASQEVRWMYERYAMYKAKRTHLLDLANYCETVLRDQGGGRKGAAEKYGIALKVLNTMGALADSKGGSIARKARGIANPLTREELRWLNQVIPMIIRRAAEVAGNPDGDHQQITMADLPPLKED